MRSCSSPKIGPAAVTSSQDAGKPKPCPHTLTSVSEYVPSPHYRRVRGVVERSCNQLGLRRLKKESASRAPESYNITPREVMLDRTSGQSKRQRGARSTEVMEMVSRWRGMAALVMGLAWAM